MIHSNGRVHGRRPLSESDTLGLNSMAFQLKSLGSLTKKEQNSRAKSALRLGVALLTSFFTSMLLLEATQEACDLAQVAASVHKRDIVVPRLRQDDHPLCGTGKGIEEALSKAQWSNVIPLTV